MQGLRGIVPSQWAGYYYDGKTAARKKVTLTISPCCIRLSKEDGSTDDWKFSEITQTQGFYEGEPVRLERGDEAVVVNDRSLATAIKATASPSQGARFAAAWGRSIPFWIPVAAVLSIAFIVSAYLWFIPMLASYAADAVSPSWEERLGRNVAAQFTKNSKPCAAEETVRRVNGITEVLNRAALPHPYRFEVHVVDDPMVNAFAAPGGHIVVFSGLIKATKTPEELAGVLAHEMQHVLRRHATKGIFENLSVYMLAAVLTGDTSGISGMIQAVGAFRYSRLHEQEADERAVDLLQRAGVNPEGLMGFFSTLEKTYGKMPAAFTYVSTHPVTAERIGYIEKRIVSPRDYAPLMPDSQWEETVAKRGCGDGKPR